MWESVFRILKTKSKVEICVRNIPQVLLRGEHVPILELSICISEGLFFRISVLINA